MNQYSDKPLAVILSNMLACAQTQPGRMFVKKLQKGLRIVMVVSPDPIIHIDKVKLSINRSDVYPSANEWKTVLDNMPWPVGHRIAQRDVNYSLTSTFIIHPKLL